jgi:mannose-6-phosphate isomerase-like protein (cupin superfamily)
VVSLHYEQKIWGEVSHFFASDHAAVSHLRVKAGYQCSRHIHLQRANMFSVLSGQLIIEEWRPKLWFFHLVPGESHTVPSGILHRFRVLESGEVIEVYWPDRGGIVLLDDIQRLDEGGRIEG